MNQSKLKLSINRKLCWIFLVIYFLLLFKAGYCFSEKFNSITAPTFFLFLLLSAVVMKVKVDKKIVEVVVALLVLIWINYILHGFPELNVIVLAMLDMISAMLIVSCVKETDFKRIFCQIVFLMCVFSIVGYVLIEVNSSIISLFPKVVNSKGRIAYFAIFTMISDFRMTGANRIQGVIWEPGAFQTIIVMAVLFEYFNNYWFNHTLIRKLVYSVALLLTFSTTGIVCLCMLWVLMLGSAKSRLKWIRILLLMLAVAFLYISFSQSLTGFLKYTLVDKVQQVLNYKIGDNNQASSRMDSIILPIKYFYDPVFGIGENGYKKLSLTVGHTMFTCTPVNYFVRYGIIFGSISFIGFWRLIKNKVDYGLEFVLALIICLISVSTENFMLNPIITVLILYGYKTAKRNCNEVHI